MATTAVDKSLYPFSTPEGQAVPVEVAKPLSLLPVNFTANVANSFVIPTSYDVVSVYSTEDCVLRFATSLPNTLVSESEYTDSIFIPGNVMMTIQVTPGTAYVLGEATGRLYLNNIQVWRLIKTSYQTSIG